MAVRPGAGHDGGVPVLPPPGRGEWWVVASVIKREAYVRDLLAPLRVDDELLDELIR
ncbi:hypothetical protein [Streptomyces sp. NBC_00859]|uniref:hypothetical protein n=1 Tax=Streptomyces sp. NBC_00859 TaxID=2903682 RepID=UPI0038647B54|nr:hypothetical protein OG584_12260 [Streptomyces sp. NBC_00859]